MEDSEPGFARDESFEASLPRLRDGKDSDARTEIAQGYRMRPNGCARQLYVWYSGKQIARTVVLLHLAARDASLPLCMTCSDQFFVVYRQP